jgi:hypothetical protein
MAGTREVADVFRRRGSRWRLEQAGHLDRVQRRVMGAIEACRTAALAVHAAAASTAAMPRSPTTRAATGTALKPGCGTGWSAPLGSDGSSSWRFDGERA